MSLSGCLKTVVFRLTKIKAEKCDMSMLLSEQIKIGDISLVKIQSGSTIAWDKPCAPSRSFQVKDAENKTVGELHLHVSASNCVLVFGHVEGSNEKNIDIQKVNRSQATQKFIDSVVSAAKLENYKIEDKAILLEHSDEIENFCRN